MSILEDFLSRDPHRIWTACGAVRACWDRGVLEVLAGDVPRIIRATEGIDLGGGLRPNARQLDFALRKFRYVAAGKGCLCALYLEDDLFAPAREAEAGHVEILAEVADQNVWASDYQCQCRVCGQHYAVHEDASYHYSWYGWKQVASAG